MPACIDGCMDILQMANVKFDCYRYFICLFFHVNKFVIVKHWHCLQGGE